MKFSYSNGRTDIEYPDGFRTWVDGEVRNMEELREWYVEHSFPIAVDVKEDFKWAEFVVSEGFSRSRMEREAREEGVSLGVYVTKRFEEWCHAESDGKEAEETG